MTPAASSVTAATRSFSRLLVANRGEVARRIIADAVHPCYGFLAEDAGLRPGGAWRRPGVGRPRGADALE